jgi:hypothetical protein
VKKVVLWDRQYRTITIFGESSLTGIHGKYTTEQAKSLASVLGYEYRER